MSNRPSTFYFSGSELYLLGLLAGGETLIGLRDPFYGWLTEEIVEALANVRSSLLARGHLMLLHDGVAFAPDLAPLVAPLATPSVVLLATVTRQQHASQEWSYHIGNGNSVRLTTMDAQYCLEPIDVATIPNEVCAKWGLVQQSAVSGQSFKIPQSALLSARDALADPQVAIGILLEAGLPDATAIALVETLKAPVTNASLAVLSRVKARWDVAGSAILEGVAGLWHLRAFEHQERSWVEVAPMAAGDITRRIECLVNQACSATALLEEAQ